MRLLLSATSPFARKVHAALLEKGLAFEPVYVTAADPVVTGNNPLGKIPALLTEAGAAIYDSAVIVQYLEALAPAPALFPEDALARVEVLRWEALCDGICDATVLRMLEGRRPPERQDAGVRAHQEAKIVRGLAALSRDLGDRANAVGDTFTLADIAVAMTIGYVDLRAPELLVAHPELQARYTALLARPSLAATAPPR